MSFTETLYQKGGIAVTINAELLCKLRSAYQELAVYRHPKTGHILTLDGIIQWYTNGEWFYHEPMAHWPLFAHQSPKDVLVIGGGDLGIARELVRHKCIARVDVVDIDRCVREVTLAYAPEIAGNAPYDSRVITHDEDAITFVRRVPDKSYDVVIMDTTDDIGCAVPLFGLDFARETHRILRNGGILIRNGGSELFQADEARTVLSNIAKCYGKKSTGMLSLPVGMYYAPPYAIGVGFKGREFTHLPERIPEENVGFGHLRFYDAMRHGSMAYPTPLAKKFFLLF